MVTNIIILQNGNEIVTNPQEVATIFNDHFISKTDQVGRPDEIMFDFANDTHIPQVDRCYEFYQHHSSITEIKKRFTSTTHFQFVHVTVKEVEKHMQNLNIAKATGPDDIPARVIKVAAKQLAPSFTSVVNNCITQGIFPFDMKKADITPVYKKT